MFVMWRETGDVKWREHGWAIWEAIEEKTRTPSGYASMQSVDQADPYPLDSMPRCVFYLHTFPFDCNGWLICMGQLLFVGDDKVCVSDYVR